MFEKAGWEMKTFKDVFSIITDGTHQTPTYTNDSINGFKFLSSKDVVGGSINWSKVKYIPKSLHNQLYSRLAPQRNDILLAKNGTTGVCAVVDNDEVFDIYVSLALLRPVPNMNVKYLTYYINSPFAKSQFNSHLKGIGVPNLHLSEIKKTKIPIPPLSIQHQIVSELDTLSNIINKKKQQLEELDRLAQATFYNMFGDLDINDKHWRVVHFNDVIEYMGDIGSNGSNATISANLKMSNVENYALMIRTLNFTANDFENNMKYVSKETYDFFKKSQIFGGEIIFNKIGSAGINFIMPYLNRPVSLGLNQIMVRLKDINTTYLYNLLNSPYGKREINSRTNGAVTKSITKGELKKIPIYIPPKELQTQFADKIASIEQQKTLINKSIEDVQQLFDYTMDKYFN